MTLRRRLAALLVSAANAIAAAEPDPEAGPAPQRTAPNPDTAPPGGSPLPQETAIRELLETCARAFIPGGRHVRANIMTFTGDGLRRKVHRATAYNVADDLDADLEID